MQGIAEPQVLLALLPAFWCRCQPPAFPKGRQEDTTSQPPRAGLCLARSASATPPAQLRPTTAPNIPAEANAGLPDGLAESGLKVTDTRLRGTEKRCGRRSDRLRDRHRGTRYRPPSHNFSHTQASTRPHCALKGALRRAVGAESPLRQASGSCLTSA